MKNWSQINSDIMFDPYGDIEFNGSDILVVSDPVEIIKQNVAARVRSNFGDYKLHQTFGANIDSHIGSQVSDALVSTIEKQINISLTQDKFLANSEVDVAGIAIGNTIRIVITIRVNVGNGYFTKINMNYVYDNGTGILHGSA